MSERRLETHKRGTVEYRVRWRRGPADQGWRTKLFQQEYAAKLYAAFLTRPNPTRRYTGSFEGEEYEDEISPIVECVIQIRDVTPWRDSEINVSELMFTRSGRY